MADETASVEEMETETTDSEPVWLVKRAQQSLENNDNYEAKAWLLTAKFLYPKSFTVQYEAYNIERTANKVEESAKLFYEMIQQFPDETLLWEEVYHMTQVLETAEQDLKPKAAFLREMFCCLPSQAQRDMLLRTAERSLDCVEKCRLLLLLMRRFPDAVPKHGLNLVEMLIQEEQSSFPDSPVNPYRKLLVCDVFPVLVGSEHVIVEFGSKRQQEQQDLPLIISTEEVFQWMELSIQFIIHCVTIKHCAPPQVSSPSTKSSSVTVEILDVIQPVHDPKGPWTRLHDLLALIAKKCGWSEFLKSRERFVPSSLWNIRECWSAVYETHGILKKTLTNASSEGGHHSTYSHSSEKYGIFYAALILFLQSVWEYCKVMNRHLFSCDDDHEDSKSSHLVLLEDLEAHICSKAATAAPSDGKPTKKKKKMADDGTKDSKSNPSIVINKNCFGVDSNLAHHFQVAVDSWHLLHTKSEYKKEFSRVYSLLSMEQWSWMLVFEVDRFLFKGKYKKTTELLQEQAQILAPKFPEALIRSKLQLACCLFCQGNYEKACQVALGALDELTSQPNSKQEREPCSSPGLFPLPSSSHSQSGGRSLYVTPCLESEVLSFCVQLLIICIEEQLKSSEWHDDTLLGHLLVLLQYDWPRHEEHLTTVIKKIEDQGSFKYTDFFNYVINIDMLEEFSYLNSLGKVKLDLLTTPTISSRSSRTVTRGVNKGAKEDFKVAMEKQVSRTDENIETLLLSFFQEERESLIKES